MMSRKIGRRLCIGLVAGVILIQAACTTSAPQDWNLKITEVAEDRIELFLNEPASRTLMLGGDMRLWTQTSAGVAAAEPPVVLYFSSVGRVAMRGEEFFIIWEDRNYRGQPVFEPYSGGQTGRVPGIKVPRNFLGRLKDHPSEVGLGGSMSVARRLIVVFPEISENRISDVVRFGQPAAARPQIGGASLFQSDGMLRNPTGSTSLQRRWSGPHALDTDRESDWVQDVLFTWGARTP